MRAIANAEKERDQANLWRAKEILQGSIPNAGYDCELFERLGIVLLQMGDLPEAGRFLFLSGRSQASYDEAIRVFLHKYRKSPRALYASFPRVARLVARADYPDAVSARLKDLGLPEILRDASGATLNQHQNSGWAGMIIGSGIVVSILAVMLLGVIKLVEIFFWLRVKTR